MANNVLVLKPFETPKESGTYFRLVCLTGASKGESYFLKGDRIIIGRSEKADIKIMDIKASREHVEIKKIGADWVATDLGSQNGVMVNNKKITQQMLSEGDKIIIGQTVYKFTKIEVALNDQNAKNKNIKHEKQEINKSKKVNPLIILVLIFVVLIVFTLPESEPQKDAKTKSVNQVDSFQDINNEFMNAIKKRDAKETKQLKERLNVIYQRGLRELRERNYYRAIHEFNLALIISPGDSQADYYLRKTKEELDREIESYSAKAQRDEDSLKFKSAIISYCAITRLLYSVPDDKRHQNAVKQIKELEAKLGLESGETDCLKKQRTNQ